MLVERAQKQFYWLVIYGWLAVTSAIAGEPASPSPIADVFVNGSEGFPYYRIPAITRTHNGILLAFAEARAARGDGSQNKIALKRSTDGGITWSALQIIAQDGENSLNNPTVVVEHKSGQIILMFQRYPKGHYEYAVIPGLTGDPICRSFVMHSDDDGVTWSKPEEITSSVKRPILVTSLASGPGIGIQLARGNHAGRILMPFNEGPVTNGNVYAVYSDDRGKSWKRGAVAPCDSKGRPNEVQMVELSDGAAMLNARNQGGPKIRKTAISHDGGESWSPVEDNPVLVEPQCQASTLRHPGTGDPASDVILFANPYSNSKRTNGTVRLSRDDGRTWPISRTLYAGGFAYNSLVSLDDKTIGCLFERDGKEISFCRFSLDWLCAKVKSDGK